MGLTLPTPGAAYLAAIKLGIVGVIAAALFIGGCNHGLSKGEALREKDHNAMQDKIDKRNEALGTASARLNDAAGIFRRISKLTLEAIERDKASKLAAAQAQRADDAARAGMERKIKDFDKRLEDARKKPDCKVLQDIDVRKVCGL